MAFGNFIFKVKSNQELVPNILLTVMEVGNGSDFLAGQYYSFKIADKINRSYSIGSAPNNKNIEFVVDVNPGGPGSIFFRDLQIGQEVHAMGPFGFFTLEKTMAAESDKPLIFIATGTGIAPFRSMVLDLLKNKKSERSMFLYFGLRYETEEYFFNEFFELEKLYPNFKFIPVISKPSENWKGEVGHCQDAVLKNEIDMNTMVYICGRNENVISISEDLIKSGYLKENVFFEKFG